MLIAPKVCMAFGTHPKSVGGYKIKTAEPILSDVSADILGKSWREMCYRFLPLPKMSAWVPVR